MAFTLGQNIKVTVSGASHAPSIGVKIEGIPAGKAIDQENIDTILLRRAGGNAVYTTARKEADKPTIISGIEEGVTTGEVIDVEFINSNVRRKDYLNMKVIPRPSHADFAAYTKFDGNIDLSGGGFFSGRMTLPMCYAGAICKQFLEEEGILIGAHIASVGNIEDEKYSLEEEDLEILSNHKLPVLSEEAGNKMEELMTKIAADGDSIGGTVECKIVGLPVGLGDPIYDSLESKIAYGMFGIPAIKGIEFGKGFDISKCVGSEANDQFCIKDGKVKTKTNNSGGIQGGISNGMPIVLKVAVKPTPSIYKEQMSVDLDTMQETVLKIEGRHDACIVPRVVPCVEAMAAIMIYDALMEIRK